MPRPATGGGRSQFGNGWAAHSISGGASAFGGVRACEQQPQAAARRLGAPRALRHAAHLQEPPKHRVAPHPAAAAGGRSTAGGTPSSSGSGSSGQAATDRSVYEVPPSPPRGVSPSLVRPNRLAHDGSIPSSNGDDGSSPSIEEEEEQAAAGAELSPWQPDAPSPPAGAGSAPPADVHEEQQRGQPVEVSSRWLQELGFCCCSPFSVTVPLLAAARRLLPSVRPVLDARAPLHAAHRALLPPRLPLARCSPLLAAAAAAAAVSAAAAAATAAAAANGCSPLTLLACWLLTAGCWLLACRSATAARCSLGCSMAATARWLLLVGW